jgi:hypothetical protein
MDSATTPRARTLRLLLRLAGAFLCTAFFAMIMPTAWMAGTHEWLGMGEFPRRPVVEYLTRSIAPLYGFHGVLMLLVASNLTRLRPVALYLGGMNLLFGTFVTVIDFEAGLPWWWSLGEGPPIAAFGLVILWLVRTGVPDEPRA